MKPAYKNVTRPRTKCSCRPVSSQFHILQGTSRMFSFVTTTSVTTSSVSLLGDGSGMALISATATSLTTLSVEFVYSSLLGEQSVFNYGKGSGMFVGARHRPTFQFAQLVGTQNVLKSDLTTDWGMRQYSVIIQVMRRATWQHSAKCSAERCVSSNIMMKLL